MSATQRPTTRRTPWAMRWVSVMPSPARRSSSASTSSCAPSSAVRVVGEAATGHLGGADRLAGGRVDGDGDRDEATLAEHQAVRQGRVADVADREAVDVDVPDRNTADDLGETVDQVDHHAVLGEHHALLGNTGRHGQCGVGAQVPPFAVHRHGVGGAHRVVQVQQLTGRGVPGDVDLRVLLGDDGRRRAWPGR